MKTMKRVLTLVLALCLMLAGLIIPAAGTAEAAKAGNVKKVVLNSKKLTMTVGETAQLSPTAKNARGQKLTAKFTYKSSNKKVVTVSNKGKVTALAAGSAKITVTEKKSKKSVVCTVKVNPPTETEKKHDYDSVKVNGIYKRPNSVFDRFTDIGITFDWNGADVVSGIGFYCYMYDCVGNRICSKYVTSDVNPEKNQIMDGYENMTPEFSRIGRIEIKIDVIKYSDGDTHRFTGTGVWFANF